MKTFTHKRILIFGGTGSLGTALTRRLLQYENTEIMIFSRDEAKHHKHRSKFNSYRVCYWIGDVRDAEAVRRAIQEHQPTLIINAAAMKQVPACEYQPLEAVKTNVLGSANVSQAVEDYGPGEDQRIVYLSISTDKAVKSVNAYGSTKALQEKIALNTRNCRVNIIRYGNVLESTGSVIPVFKKLLEQDKPVMITDRRMTRFLLSLDEAVTLILVAAEDYQINKQILIPFCASAKMTDLAKVLCEAYGKNPENYITYGKIRPGEKLDEVLVSEEECHRLELGNWHYRITPFERYSGEYTESFFSSGSSDRLLDKEGLVKFLTRRGVIKCTQSESLAAAASSETISQVS